MLPEHARALWAKSEPRHELWRHLLDIAAVAKSLAPRFWPDGPLPVGWLCFLIALHDIGKADPLFQSKAPEAVDDDIKSVGLLEGVDPDMVRGFRHEARSAEWLIPYLGKRGWPPEVVRVVAAVIRGHHGNFRPKERPDEHATLWNPLREELVELLEYVLQPEPDFRPQAFVHANVSGVLFVGLVVLSDWIASSTHPFGYHLIPKTDDPQEYFELACKRALEVVSQLELADLPNPFAQAQPLKLTQVWPEIAALRPSQEALEETVLAGVSPGLAILEAPMGEGKTESAVYLAEEWNRQRGCSGVYIALPTMATSNQMYNRYARYLKARPSEQGQPRLIHGMAWLVGDDLPDAPQTDDGRDSKEAARIRMWLASPKRALLALEAVGTVDQALMSALNVKHGFLRLCGLARKVLVIDEVHAYDAYMQAILQRLLAWCRELRVPVILLSATLSRSQKANLIAAYTGQALDPVPGVEPYPLLTFAALGQQPFVVQAKSAYTQKHIELRLEPGLLHDAEATARKAASLVEGGGCVCVLANTVRRAQAIFEELGRMKAAGQMSNIVDLRLFHARFPAERRDEIEKDVFRCFGTIRDPETKLVIPNPERPPQAILVATQVVEQSLDVCFDVMLSDLAPVDLLLQRLGRLHRHVINPRFVHEKPVLHILLPSLREPFDFGRIELKRGKDGEWRGVYDRATLLRTLAVLPRGHFTLPADFRDLIESVYGGATLEADALLTSEIADAERARRHRAEDLEARAKTHLIPLPDPEVFSYAQATEAVDEAEDGQRQSYFRAQTRLGDDTRAAIILTRKNLINAYKNALDKAAKDRDYQPKKDFLKRLFWQKVNLPGYWMLAEPADGFEPFDFAEPKDRPGWLRNHRVVIAPGGEWWGLLDGKPVRLKVDDVLGVLFESDTSQTETEGIEGA
ncbi:MAG: CRISPR-associated helicase Cas3' [Meiothermus sp.]|nr:CRISPR-associated helicase Cas3' [Meiothermus sp.]